MPKRENDTPEKLRPYIAHGVDLTWRHGDKDATADCPMCGNTEDKFGVKIETGVYNCFRCSSTGNDLGFIRWLWDVSEKKTDNYDELTADRGLRFPDTLMHWGVCRSYITNEWLVPGFDIKNNLRQLYRYTKTLKGMLLRPTPTLGHWLHGVNVYRKGCGEVFLCEGPWDGMALWEEMGHTRLDGDKFVSTSNQDRSLLANASVLAVPGCGVFFDSWLSLFTEGVSLMYDSDHPGKHPKTGSRITPAGLAGMQRTAGILTAASQSPDGVRYLHWGDGGFDPALLSGTDVRDYLCMELGGVLKVTSETRRERLAELLDMLRPIPKNWVGKKRSSRGGTLECQTCTNYSTLVNSWHKALKWTDGLDRALSVMLATSMSTMFVGEQLWIKVIGPPSSGKTTLLEGLAVNKKYIFSKDTIRGFYSGWKSSKDGDRKDQSIAAKARNKTLATKDGDTLLKSPNLKLILAEGRGLYDRVGRTQYRNEIADDYEGHCMTWILCGTAALREIDDSELGARFLDCVVMDDIDDEFEDDVGWRAANQEAMNMLQEADGTPETKYPPEQMLAMCLTGGYVGYLRDNAAKLSSGIIREPESLQRCNKLAKFVSYMRARPSRHGVSENEREFSARLAKQLTRLAIALAAVLNCKSLDEQVMQRVTRVAMDTARGLTLGMLRYLYKNRVNGCDVKAIANHTNEGQARTRTMLRFLRQIGVVELHTVTTHGVTYRGRWKLTNRLTRLYEEVRDGTHG